MCLSTTATSTTSVLLTPVASTPTPPPEPHQYRSATASIVRFSETTRTRQVQGLWEMSVYEKNSIYYTDADFKDIATALRSTARVLRRATKRGTTVEDLTSGADTGRGIEHLASSAILKQLQAQKEYAVSFALTAQEGGVSAEQMARATAQATRGAVERAVQRAQQDEQAVRPTASSSIAPLGIPRPRGSYGGLSLEKLIEETKAL